MKSKILVAILVVALLLCVASIATFAAGPDARASQVDASGQWEYESYGSGVMLTEHLGSKADVYVPATIEANGNTYNVLKLADGIFKNNDGINSVTLSEGVVEIGKRAFYDCDSLVCILLPESLTTIGEEAFRGCDIFNSVILYDGVTSIGKDAFADCEKLTVWCNEETEAYKYVKANHIPYELLTTTSEPEIIELDNGMTFYVQNGSASIVGYTGEATEVVVPATVNGYPVVEIREAFKENQNIVSVVLPEGLKTIGAFAFTNCDNLETVKFPESLISIGNYVFYDCEKLNNVTLPSNLQTIGDYAFASCHSFTEIIIPSSVKTIGRNCFAWCEKVTKLVISEGVESFDAQAFDSLSITEVTIPSTITVIGAVAFQNCKLLTKVNLHEGITTIKWLGFNGCDNLRTIVIPKSVTEIGDDAFSGSTVLAVYADSYGEEYVIEHDLLHAIYDGEHLPEIYETDDGFVYFIKDKEAFLIDYTGQATEVVVPATVNGYPVVEIREAFKENQNIVSVVLPEGLKTIGAFAFTNCDNLETVKFPESLISIENDVFYGCEKLNNVTLPSNLQTIGDYAFALCHSFTEIIIPSSVKTIGRNCFSWCEKVTKLVISEGVESFDAQAFDGLNITEVTIPSTITVIELAAFQNCKSLTKVNLHEGITTIKQFGFVGCDNLRTIVIPKSVTEIEDDAFSGSTVLVVYPDSYALTYAEENNLLYHVMQKTENPEVAYGASIEGSVIKNDGSAAAGATVEIYYSDGTFKERVVADENGKYTFTYAEVGSYIIKATLGNGTASTTVRVTRMNVFDVFITGDTDITLKYSYTVSGSVNVYPSTVTITDTKGNVIASTITNDGGFSFEGIPNGEYIITVESENGFTSSEITVFDGNLSDLNLAVERTGVTLWGYVEVEGRDYNRYHKNWVDVTIYGADGNFVANGKTDADGKYLFINLPVGEYSIVASATEMLPDKDHGYDRSHDLFGYGHITVNEEGSYQVDTIVLSEDRGNGASIEGKVTANGEKQICEIILKNVFGHEIAKFNTKSNGKYKFTNISDGLYFITAITESNGMGYEVVLVRDGIIYGETDIKITKSDKVKDRESNFFNDIPELHNKNEVEQYRSRIAEEKRFYDSLSKKEQNQLSKEYVGRLNLYIEWLANCEYGADGGATVEQGGLVISGDELEKGDDVSFIINVEKQDKWENNEHGVENERDHLHNNMKDKANGNIVEYYEITMFKTQDGKEKPITSVYKDTDANGKFRITLVIPEEYRGYKHYTLVHVHCGEVVTLVDLDDDPNTITVEIDRFSTFALTTTDTELIDEDVTIDYNCGNSDSIPHTWVDATCESPKTCSVCNETEGEALGHKWVEADCDTPNTCSVCNATEGEALGHKWFEATTEAPKTCDRCNSTEGDKLPAPTPDNKDNTLEETPDNGDTSNEEEKDHSKCLEEASGWQRFWNAIASFFRSIFSKYVECVCGDKVLKEEYTEFKRIFKQNK